MPFRDKEAQEKRKRTPKRLILEFQDQYEYSMNLSDACGSETGECGEEPNKLTKHFHSQQPRALFSYHGNLQAQRLTVTCNTVFTRFNHHYLHYVGTALKSIGTDWRKER